MPGAIGQPLEISPLAGRLGPKRMLVDMAWLELECYSCRPDLDDPSLRERRWRWTYLRRPEGRDSRYLSRVDPPGLVVAGCTRYSSAPGPAQPGKGRPMNVPGPVKGNWRWRANRHMRSAREFQWSGDLTKFSNRSASVQLLSLEAAS